MMTPEQIHEQIRAVGAEALLDDPQNPLVASINQAERIADLWRQLQAALGGVDPVPPPYVWHAVTLAMAYATDHARQLRNIAEGGTP